MANEPLAPEQNLRNELGPEGGFIGKSVDELEQESRTDKLSGLLNKRGLEEAMKTEFNRAVRHHTAFSVAMVDLDDFKIVNDTYGHRAGDEVIRRVGSAVRGRFRDEDVKGRYGGDEILVMLVDTRFPSSVDLTHEQNNIASDLMSRSHQAMTVGLVQWDGLESLEQVIERADKKLYEEKRLKKAQKTENV